MLKIDKLHTYYGDIKVLDIEELHVDEGEIVALIGANGAGKSTLLKTISGQVRPREGTITYLTERIDTAQTEYIVAKGLIQVPEGRQIFPALTVQENLMMGAFLIKDKEQIKANIRDVYELFPRLEERQKNFAQTLSGGEQQMLALGRALMGTPTLMMLDEPSLGIAPILTEDIFKVIKKLNERGLAILLVEQNVLLALEVSDRAYVIENGSIVLSGNSEELKKNKEVEKAYMGI